MGARNIVRLLGDALIASEPFDLASGETLTITPEVSAQGDIDLTGFGDITLSATTLTLAGVLGITGATTVTGALAVTGGIRHKVTNLTSNTSLTVANGANGIITNRGAAGAVVVTLPDDATAGDWFAYVGVMTAWTCHCVPSKKPRAVAPIFSLEVENARLSAAASFRPATRVSAVSDWNVMFWLATPT